MRNKSLALKKKKTGPPYSRKLKVDEKLKSITYDDEGGELTVTVKQILINGLKNVKNSALETMLKSNAYPNDYVLVEFASKAYKNSHSKLTENLPEGWKLLTTASNTGRLNGYFGAAYWHPEQQQVVIAHRGTVWKNLGALDTDLNGIVLNKYTRQMYSAATFADKICHAINELKEESKINFQLSFTGHSLGGWLAQITTFTTQYLQNENSEFLHFPQKQQQANCHSHTVVFDSPGCEAMLLKMKDDLDVRYYGRSISLNSLDITSYLSAPNRINTCNKHVGTIYRIFIDLSGMNSNVPFIGEPISWGKKFLLYNIITHSIDGIKKVFDPTTGKVHIDDSGKLKVQEVIDWPVVGGLIDGGEEWNSFFKWAKHFNDYHPEPNDEEFQQAILKKFGYYPIRYQTKHIDEKTHSISVFSQNEFQFLESWLALKNISGNVLKLKKLEEFLENQFQITKKLLDDLSLEGKAHEDIRIHCASQKVTPVIHYVKQLLRWRPGILTVMKEQISIVPGVAEVLYKAKSQDYLSALPACEEWVKFNNNLGIREFLTNDNQRVLHLATQTNTEFEVSRLYNLLNQMEAQLPTELKTHTDNKQYSFLSLEQILNLEQSLNVIEFFIKSKMENLLVLENQSQGELNAKTKQLFEGLFKGLKDVFKKKIIVITPQDGNLYQYIHNLGASLKEKFEEKKVTGIQFIDLLPESQDSLKVNFQGQEVPLRELVEDKDDKLLAEKELNELINTDTLIKLIKKDAQPLMISSEPLRLSDIEAAHTKLNERITKENLVDALGRNDDIFLINVIGQHNLDSIVEYDFKNQITLYKDSGEESNLKYFKQLCHDNQDKTIHWIEVTNDQLLWKQIYDPEFYIERHFKKTVIKKAVKELLVKQDFDDLFVVSGVSILKPLLELLEVSETEITLVEQCVFPTDSEDSAEAKFKKLVKQAEPAQSVHWLKIEEKNYKKQLIWYRSHGSLTKLRKYIDTVNSDKLFRLAKGDFSQFKDRVVIIADEPGMGKSTTLTYLSEQKLKSDWIIRINLKDCQKEIEKLQPRLTLDYVAKFLSMLENTDLNTHLAEKLVKHNLKWKTKRPLLLLFDGFDEINEVHQQKVIQLLQFLKKETPVNVLVTTRFNQMKNLENHLSVFATSFEALSQEEQTEFLKRFWKTRLDLTLNKDKQNRYPGKFQAYAHALLNIADKVLGENTARFMGVPLQMRMVAEAFQSEFKVFMESKFDYVPNFNLHDISDLYKRFIDKKYEIYFKEKTGLAAGFNEVSQSWFIEPLTKRHRRLAFKLLFPDEVKSFLWGKSPFLYKADGNLTLNPNEEIELNRVGIIYSTKHDNKFEFIHRTFAEYFTADLVVNWLRKPKDYHLNMRVQELLLMKILLKNDYKVIRLFLNCQLGKSSLTEISLIPRLISLIDEFLNESLRYTVLHVAAEEGHTKIVSILFESLKEHCVTLKALVVATDGNGKTALHLAAENGHVKVVQKLLDFLKDNRPETLKALVVATDKFERTALHLAAENGHVKVVHKLLDFLKDNLPENLKALVVATDKFERTALHRAAEAGRVEVVQKLLDFVKDNLPETLKALVVAIDIFKRTALHLAAENGHVKVVQKLLDFVKDNLPQTLKALVVATDEFERAALHYATRKGHFGVVQMLLDSVKDNPETLKSLIVATDEDKRTALHLAVKTSDVEVIQKMSDFVKDYLPETPKTLGVVTYEDKRTALHREAEERQKLLNFLEDNLPEALKDLLVATDEYKKTDLYYGPRKGHFGVVQMLLDSVKDNPETLKSLIVATDEDKRTALHYAATEGHVEVVQIMLNSMKDNPDTLMALVVATDENNDTALHYAARKGHFGVVQMLLDSVKDNPDTLMALVVATDEHKVTALHYAAMKGHVEVVQIMLDFVKDNLPETLKDLVLATDEYKKTALHYAARKGHFGVVQMLLDSVKDNPETLKYLMVATDEDKRTALHLAAKTSHVKLVQKLLYIVKENLPETIIALVVATDKFEKTALHLAAEAGHVEVVQKMLDFVKDNLPETLKALVVATDKFERTALHLAAEAGHVKVVQKLLDFSKDNLPEFLKTLVEAKDIERLTHLCRAALCVLVEVIQKLLDFVEDNLSETLKALIVVTDNERNVIFQRNTTFTTISFPLSLI